MDQPMENSKHEKANSKDGESHHGHFKLQDKPGRLIIRNLQFDIKEKHLKSCFSKYLYQRDTRGKEWVTKYGDLIDIGNISSFPFYQLD